MEKVPQNKHPSLRSYAEDYSDYSENNLTQHGRSGVNAGVGHQVVGRNEDAIASLGEGSRNKELPLQLPLGGIGKLQHQAEQQHQEDSSGLTKAPVAALDSHDNIRTGVSSIVSQLSELDSLLANMKMSSKETSATKNHHSNKGKNGKTKPKAGRSKND